MRLVRSLGRIPGYTHAGKLSSDVFILMMGTVVSQAVAVASTPLLTRLFEPENFGVFGLFLSVVAILSAPASGRYDQAILLPQEDRDAYALLALSCLLGFLFSACFAVVVAIADLETWSYLAALGVFLTVAMASLSGWHNRKRHYRLMACSRVAMTSTVAAISASLGLAGFGNQGLIVGSILGTLLGTTLLLTRMPRMTGLDLWAVAKRYVRFPKFLILGHFINALSHRLPILLLAPMFGFATAGFFTVTQRVVGLPALVVASAVGEVFRRKASEDYRAQGNCRDIYMSTLVSLAALSFVTFSLFFVLAPWLFELVFGAEWRPAGEMARILTPMVAVQFVASPLSAMFMIAERQHLDIIWQIVLLTGTAAAFGIGYLTGSEFITLICFSGAYTIMYLANVVMTYRFACGK